MKFVMLVEGETEKKVLPPFLKRWLDARIGTKVGIQVVQFDGWADLVKGAQKKVEVLFNAPNGGEIIAIIGLLDLYGPTVYPPNKLSCAERHQWFKADLEAKVDHPRFRQHFAVHECEAWLLSDSSVFPDEIKRALAGKCAHPETVNNDEPPKKLLQRLYRDKLRAAYKQVTHGAELFADLNPQTVHDKCPQFRAMLDDMLALAKAAGL